MTIPFPVRISYPHAFAFSALLTVGLLAEGNPAAPCLYLFAIVMVGAVGFNRGGGMRNPTGAYVFFVVLFTGILGASTKLVLNEPLLENAPNAEKTFGIYLAGVTAMTAAVYLSRSLSRQVPILKNRLSFERTSLVMTGCLVAGVLLPFVLDLLFPGGAGAVGTLFAQLNIALPLCISVGVYQKVRETRGMTSFNWPGFLALCFSTYTGLVGFSKEGIFGGSAAWLVACAAGRLRIGPLKIIIVSAVAAASVYVLVPYSQYGRNFRLSYGGNAAVAMDLLAHPLATRKLAYANQPLVPTDRFHYFKQNQGIFDRLTLVAIDSALVERTDTVGPIGWGNVGLYLTNIVPHFLLPDKPNITTGNQYAHELGMLAPDDHTTGISFSPFAEAYHLGGWAGVAFLLPAVECLMFVVLQSVTGDLDDSPWGLFFIAYFAHGAAEGMLQIPVRMASVGAEAILACALFMIYVTPIIGQLIIGPDKRIIRTTRVVRAIPARRSVEG